ncbi:hypothetical protein DFJ74DRAFT_676433 [Hyaloraphidium curvatum]|nr:hypothetical protein DFJ74DRAFT_698143 [Hyaloraphidium curvatum]KAI9018230.1 hypothetical protein DFJ74DRAFT_676433 [Hyaloraphidium curvatum]
MSPHEQRDAIMSSPEARDEKEVRSRFPRTATASSPGSAFQFWASPPAKTPRTERHQLLTPVKSGKKQPDDWWLKSPFKSEKGGRHGKFHEKVDFRSPGGFGKLASRFGDIQMLEHDAAPTAAVAGPASPARRGNLLFSDFLPAPSSPANHGQQAHQPGDFVALLMFPEAAAQDQPLPFELLCRVLAYLPPPDLVRCMVLSKSWCNAAAPALWSEIRVRSTVGWSKIFGVLKGKSTPASDASLFEDPPGSPRRSSRLASPARPAMPFGAHRRSGPRAAVYRSLVRAWSYSSIDADGKRLPTTRGATLSILRGLLTSRVYMPNLRRVSLAGGAEWADDGFLRMLAAGFGGVLEHLSLSGCRNVTRAALLASLPEFRALRSVRIEYSSEVDAAVVSRIAALGVPCVAVVYCGSLDDAAVALLSGCRELEVTFCPGVTFGAGIRGLLARAEGLEVLRAGYITWSEPPRGQTARFPRGMRELDLSGLPVLDARVSLPASLRRLVLRELPQAATAAALARLLKRCTSLEVLDVGGTPFAPGEREEAGRWCAGRGVRMVADD